jgi:hypothetical protein
LLFRLGGCFLLGPGHGGRAKGKEQEEQGAGEHRIGSFNALYTPHATKFITAGRVTFAAPDMLNDEIKQRLRERLDQVHEWPSVYMFKFIFEPEQERLDRVLALFPKEAEVLRKYSTGGKYVSITAREVMLNADDVVARYDKASDIDGVIVL